MTITNLIFGLHGVIKEEIGTILQLQYDTKTTIINIDVPSGPFDELFSFIMDALFCIIIYR